MERGEVLASRLTICIDGCRAHSSFSPSFSSAEGSAGFSVDCSAVSAGSAAGSFASSFASSFDSSSFDSADFSGDEETRDALFFCALSKASLKDCASGNFRQNRLCEKKSIGKLTLSISKAYSKSFRGWFLFSIISGDFPNPRPVRSNVRLQAHL